MGNSKQANMLKTFLFLWFVESNKSVACKPDTYVALTRDLWELSKSELTYLLTYLRDLTKDLSYLGPYTC